jgi:hypothetical protein
LLQVPGVVRSITRGALFTIALPHCATESSARGWSPCRPTSSYGSSRRQFFRAKRSKHASASSKHQIRSRAKNIAARSNELGQSTAAEMRALMDAVDTAPGKPGFSCYDPTLAQRLRQAADQAAAPAEMKLRAAVFTEGPAGVANAIKNLWAMCGRLRVVKEIERVAAWSRQPCVRPFDAVQHDRWPLCLPRIRSRSIPRI